MKKVKLNDSFIYIDDEELDVKKTGVVIENDDELEKTQEIVIDEDVLSDTMTNIWGEENEQ